MVDQDQPGRRTGSLLRVGGVVLLAVAGIVALVFFTLGQGRPAAVAAVSMPQANPVVNPEVELLDPLDLQPLTKDQAFAFNAAIPISDLPNPKAAPFILPETDPVAYARALDCLTAAVYYEAGFEPDQGQSAVAQVVLNRLRHPIYPKSVCGVVFQGSERATGCQFTFTCDGALARPPEPAGWARAEKTAAAALAGQVAKQVGYATHYHTVWVAPYWAPTLLKVANIGAHIFYRSPTRSSARLFAGQYGGSEPDVSILAQLAAFVPLRTARLSAEAAAAAASDAAALPPLIVMTAAPEPAAAVPTEIITASIDVASPDAPPPVVAPAAPKKDSFFPRPDGVSHRPPLPQL